MQWFVRWLRRLQRLWFQVWRFLLGLLPLFAGDFLKWLSRAPRRPRDAAAPMRSYLDRFVRSETEIDHPLVDDLRRRATNELFDWLGLVMIPRQTWAILDKVGDPGGAIEQLIRALGCDPLAARRREPAEIARLEVAIDTLVALDSLRPYLREDHLSEIEYLLFSGDYEAVKTYSRVIAALVAVLLGRERAENLRRFAVYESFLRNVESYVADPWSLSPEEAEEALGLSDLFVTAMESYTGLYLAISETLEAIARLWPAGAAVADADLRDGLLLHFEKIDDRLVKDPHLDLGRIDDELNQAAELLDACEALLDGLEDDTGGDDAGRTDTGGGGAGGPDTGAAAFGEIDEALDFFGFAAGTSPPWPDIKAAYRTKMKEVHPDGKPPGERAHYEEQAKRANLRFDLLRRRFSRTP